MSPGCTSAARAGDPFVEHLEPRRLLATTCLNAVYFNNSDFTRATSSCARQGLVK